MTEFRRAGFDADKNPVLCFTGDFTVVEDMVKLRTQVETGMTSKVDFARTRRR